MTQNDFLQFGELMAVLGEAFSKEPSAYKIEIYFRALKDLSIEEIKTAVDNIIKTRTITGTFPLVSEIREAVNGNIDDKAVIAISKIEDAIRSIGAYSNVVFDDPLIHAVIVRYGGWVKLCEVTSDEWKFLRKDLEKHYKALARTYSNSNHLPEVPSVLIGIHGGASNEEQLKAIGRSVPVSYVGDHRKAVEWSRHR